MDELAGRYLTLCLRLGRHVPDLVDTYIGPDRLDLAVRGEPRRLAERLASEADRIAADVTHESTLPADRGDWLTAQLVAVGTVARRVAGDELPPEQYLRRVLDVEVTPVDEERVGAAVLRLDRALGGVGPLAGRLRRWAGATGVDRHGVERLLPRALDALRGATTGLLRLPEGEAVSVGRVGEGDTPRRLSTSVRLQRSYRSTLDVTLTPPVPLGLLLRRAAADAYPGRHTERVLRLSLLADQFGRSEATLWLRAAPERVVSTGVASLGLDALAPRHERELLLDDLATAAGHDLDAGTELEIAAAFDELDWLDALAALRVASGDEDGARHLLERWDPVDRDPRGVVAGFADLEAVAATVARPLGREVVATFLEKEGSGPAGLRRLLTEQLTPSALRAGR